MGATGRARAERAERDAAEDLASSLSASIVSGDPAKTAEALATLRQVLGTASPTPEDRAPVPHLSQPVHGPDALRASPEPRRQHEASSGIEKAERLVPYAEAQRERRIWLSAVPWLLLIAALIALAIIEAPRPWLQSLVSWHQSGAMLRGATHAGAAPGVTSPDGVTGTGSQGAAANGLQDEAQALAAQMRAHAQQTVAQHSPQPVSAPSHIWPLPPTPPPHVPARVISAAKPSPVRTTAIAPAARPPTTFSMNAGLIQQMQNESMQLVTARSDLAAGRVEDAKPLIESVRAQLALQPVIPGEPVPSTRDSASASDLGRALEFLDAGHSRLALAALDRAINEFSAESAALVTATTEAQ